jgi:branched-chain amino acid transport system ATP-binding protein
MRLGVARSFQVPQLCAEMTVLDNVIVAAACASEALSFWRPAQTDGARGRALQLLERFALAGHAERRVAELPGGVRKLLDIAMSLTRRPRLLLLDEPTSGVSVDEKFPMMDTVMAGIEGETAGETAGEAAGEAAGAGTAVLFVEHDMEIVSRYASRVVAFYSGRILADGAPATVLADADVRRHVTGGLK